MAVAGEQEAELAEPRRPVRGEGKSGGFAPKLFLWMGLWITVQAVAWLGGIPQARLHQAIERGAAEIERRAVGEMGDDEIREAIALQRATYPFFRALTWMGDFVCGPLGLLTRGLASAACFAGMAAVSGRPIQFGRTLAQTTGAQGFWVAGLATQVGLCIALGRAEVETSASLLLPVNLQSAAIWLAARQVDVFALAGWSALALGAWKRGQASLATASLAVLLLWGTEAALRVGCGLLLGAWMRLTLLPETGG